MLKATVIDSGIVMSRPGQMYGWPGLTRTGSGDLLVMASERKHHVCPFGREVISRSSDGGRTWTLPEEIHNSELDDRDSTLATMPDGTVIASWFTSSGWMETSPSFFRPEWKARSERVTQKMLDELVGDWMIRSSDGGATWELSPTRMPLGGAEHNGPFALFDGRLVCFGYEKEGSRLHLHFYESRDVGRTWNRLGDIQSEYRSTPEPGLYGPGPDVFLPTINERSLLELAPDRLLVHFRNEETGLVTQTQSNDGGRTWDPTIATGISGRPPHLSRLHNGAILCTYGHRAEPWSIRAVLSYDDGATWDTKNIITLDRWSDQPDMGYPSSIEVRPGEILTVYYCSRAALTHLPQQEKAQRAGASPEGILYKRTRLD